MKYFVRYYCIVIALTFFGQASFSQDTLIATGDYNYPPYEFINKQGQPDGFNVALLGAIGEASGLHFDIRLQPWHRARKDLLEGRADIITGMFSSAERAREFLFSVPHSMVTQGVISRENEKLSEDDLIGKSIIVQKGDIMHDYMHQHNLSQDIITAETPLKGINILLSGKGAAFLGSYFQAMYYINKLQLNLVAQPFEDIVRAYCFALPKGDEALLARINEGLKIIKESGRYDEIYQEYFGVYEQEKQYSELLDVFIWAAILLAIISLLIAVWVFVLRKEVKRKTKDLSKELMLRKETEQKLERANHQLRQMVEELQQQETSLLNAYEKAKRADELKSVFLANISHDIRTPLNSILGFSDILENEKINTEDRMKFIRIIHENGQNLNKLLTDLLEASRLESGDITLNIRPFDFNDMLSKIYNNYLADPKIRNGKIVFVNDHDKPDQKLMVNSDPDRILQVYQNLINNALKFTESGTIRFGYKYMNEEKLLCYVQDTGSGIPEDQIELIFERFRQADQQSSFYLKGVGLGLSICRHLVHMLGGSIHVESKLFEGSTFSFTINSKLKF